MEKQKLDFDYVLVEDKPKRKPRYRRLSPRALGLLAVILFVVFLLGVATYLFLGSIPVANTNGRLSNAADAERIGSSRLSTALGWLEIPPQSQFIAWSPDGKTLAVGGFNTIQIYHTDNLEAVPLTIDYTLGTLQAFAYSPDSHYIVTADDYGRMVVWDTANAAMFAAASGPMSNQAAIAFQSDGKILMTNWPSRTITTWDQVSEPQTIGLTEAPETIRGLAISPDSKLIVAGDGSTDLWMWNAQTGLALHRWFDESYMSVGALAFSPDGSIIATGDDTKFVKTWNTERQNNLFGHVGHGDMITALAFSPDGKILASGSGSLDTTVRLWRWDNQTPDQYVDVLQGHRLPVQAVAFSPDGKKLAVLLQGILEESGSIAAYLWLWDMSPVAAS